MVLSAIAMGVFAFYGVKAITILGYVAIPAIVFLSIATTIRSMGVLGSWEPSWPTAPRRHHPRRRRHHRHRRLDTLDCHLYSGHHALRPQH